MMTVDGFFEGKNKDISWHHVDDEFNDFAIDQLDSADMLFFGRLTYELMAGYWPTPEAIKNDPLVSERMNAISKVVFSTTLNKADWYNTILIKNNIEKEIRKLKQNGKKDIFIFGSADLSAKLIPLNLIDEYRIMINPVILVEGVPLFKQSSVPIYLRLLEAKRFHSGIVLLIYEPKR
jgi:dihydrofolate reductase